MPILHRECYSLISIRECSSTHYIGWTSIVRTLIQKSMGMGPLYLRLLKVVKGLACRKTV